MDWVFEHLKLIILIGGAIAYWLNQRKKANEEQEAGRNLSAPSAPPPAQPELTGEAERVRRIQEEIRRKIQERASGGMAKKTVPVLPQPGPAPVAAPVQRQVKQDAYAQDSSDAAKFPDDQELLQRQQVLAEKLRELEQQRRYSAGRAEVFAEKTAVAMAAADAAPRGSLLADLRNPSSARRAIVLREVLGTPVGLR